jgi:hypothetical protein
MKTPVKFIIIAVFFTTTNLPQTSNIQYLHRYEKESNNRSLEEKKACDSKDDSIAYKLKNNDREAAVYKYNGQNVGEKQLEMIKATLIEDFLVNDDKIDGEEEQYSPAISMDESGAFVITWKDERNGNWDIYYQRYDSSGLAIGINTKVNDDIGNSYQESPAISMDESGNFVIVWEDKRNGNSDIYYQKYNGDGVAEGINIKANDDTETIEQLHPTIEMDGSGNFVITWTDNRNGNWDIYYQRFNISGVVGINTKVNDDYGSEYGNSSTISMDGSGNFVIVWEDTRNGNYDIYYQQYINTGMAQGVNTKVNDDFGSEYQGQPTISMDGSGNFVIAWIDQRNNGNIYFQRYNNSGIAQGINVRANDDAGSIFHSAPKITVDEIGNFVITWADFRNSNDDIYYQRYNIGGIVVGVNKKANDDVGSESQYSPTISIDGIGNFVIAWADHRNLSGDIYFQQFTNTGVTQGVNTKANDDYKATNQLSPAIAMDADGNFVIVWEDTRNGNYDIYFQRYNNDGVTQGINIKANDDALNAIQESAAISMDGNGNFVIVWRDKRNGNYDIYFQMYNSNGVGVGINTKANDDALNAIQESAAISMDGNGNFVIVWRDNRNYNYDIYYQRYDSSGVAIGTNIKANDDAGNESQHNPTISIDASGNFVIAWMDARNENAWDIYYQRYNISGVKLGVNTKVNDDTVNSSQIFLNISMNGSGDLVLTWVDNRNGDFDIYFQQYSFTGIAQGVNTKVNDDAGSSDQMLPKVSVSGNGNFVIVWVDYRYNSNNPYLIGQRYFSSGVAICSNYIIVADGPNHIEKRPVVAVDNNKMVFSWEDNRNVGAMMDIYAKIVDWDWNGIVFVSDSEDNYLYPDFSLSQNYPNPFNSNTHISWQSPVSNHQSLKIYDLLGREVAKLVDEYRDAGSYEIDFNASNLASGIYFYKLSIGSFTEVKKMSILK